MGDSVTLSATPNHGWAFDGWYIRNFQADSWEELSGMKNPVLTLTAGGAPAYQARFTQTKQDTLTVTVIASPAHGGAISGGGTFNLGETVILRATPNPGWTFDGWYAFGTLVETSAVYQFIPNWSGDYTAEARFTQNVTPTPSAIFPLSRPKIGNMMITVQSPYHTVGLKTNGTVVAAGTNSSGECNVSSWTDIVAIAAADHHTIGLKADGTVVATGSNEWGECDVSFWKDIVAIATGYSYTLGLKSDGTVNAVGNYEFGEGNISSGEQWG